MDSQGLYYPEVAVLPGPSYALDCPKSADVQESLVHAHAIQTFLIGGACTHS